MSQNQCGCGGKGPLPEVTFSTFVLSLASAALVHLGEVADPETGQTGQTGQQPELARHSISMLEMLHEKTTKGLDEQERKMLESILYELRMKYVIKYGPDSK